VKGGKTSSLLVERNSGALTVFRMPPPVLSRN